MTLAPVLGAVGSALVTHPVPTGAGFSLLLVAHVAAALVGFGALGLSGLQAARARRGPAAPGADAVRRWFRPGANWAGRVLYLVPVLGYALVADSQGAFDAGDSFVVAGLVLWLVAVVMAEGVLWPAERRIQHAVADRWETAVTDPGFDRDCRLAAGASAALAVVFVAGLVVMFGKP